MTQELANYDEMLANLAKKATATEAPSSSKISVKAGILSYNGQAAEGNKLDCIIIASTHTNLFYEEKYDSDNITSPVCYAYSEDPDEFPMVPHPKASKPQADDCESCWANQWGSGKGRGKACKNSRTLAVVPGGVTAEDIATAEVATLNLPVMTVSKMWSPYVHKLSALYQRPPLAMVTTVGVKPDAKSQFLITFDDAGPVDKSLIPGLIARAGTVKALLERVYEPNPEPTEEDEERAAKAKNRAKKF